MALVYDVDHVHENNSASWCRCVKWVGHSELLVHQDQLPCGGHPAGGIQHHDLRRPQDMVT